MNKITINADLGQQKISRHLYGHFAEHLGRCIYEGLWVGEDSPIANTRGFRNDVVAALKQLRIPNLRWPGGCFADTYHWMDGIGPHEKRPSIVNVHWGGVTESNACGTHEFMDLCEQLSLPGAPCEPYIAGNVGSGTVREMAEWLEYITMPGESPMASLRRSNGREQPWPMRFWGVGNENWGCGGNMRPQYYADLYRQYASYCRHFTPQGKLYKVACGLTDEWNDILMRDAGRFMDGLSVHYYTVPGDWAKKGSATDFDTNAWRVTIQKAANIETFIRGTSAIMDRYDPQKRVGIVMDEWGTWFDVEPGTNPGFLYQQNTIRDAVVAGLSLNVFNNHADRMQVANIAQTVNVMQAMILTEGRKMLLTPTYHVFEMYKVHQDATLLPTTVQAAAGYLPAARVTGTAGAGGYDMLSAVAQVSASASRDEQGRIHVSLCNLHEQDAAEIAIDFRGVGVTSVRGRVLTAPAMNALNTFDSPDAVKPTAFDSLKLSGSTISGMLPARSVAVLEVR
ncbi:MAG TPA: alpha-N-arabinofuranosidase [Tepidisphaeraceae bacterium]|jgi:alpha-N-arabinofuranosidase|nr:alpha-N-arabinofuranosidase [Tepidisphaeraceae bacterium]